MYEATISQSRFARRGYSLLELMIVLAILVSVMAVAWPRIARRIQLIGPREAALQLKSHLAETREQAVVSGVAWVLRIERGGAEYQIGPVSIFRDQRLSSTSTSVLPASVVRGDTAVQDANESPHAASHGNTTLKIQEYELPVGIVFDDGFAHDAHEANRISTANSRHTTAPLSVSQPSPWIDVNDNRVDVTDNWSYTVVFQPDGRSTESEIRLLEQATENTIRLRVRGFTGGVTVDRLERKKPMQMEQMEFDPLESLPTPSVPRETMQTPFVNDVLLPQQRREEVQR